MEAGPTFIRRINWEEVNWTKLLRKASKNRVLYAISKNLLPDCNEAPIPLKQKLVEISRLGDLWLTKLCNTLEFIEEHFSMLDVDYLIVKTNRSLPYITYDVDVLVHQSDFNDVVKFLSRFGKVDTHPRKQKEYQKNIFVENILTIDLHMDFSWEGSKYVSNRFVWGVRRKDKIVGVFCPTPSFETELLLNMAHVLFERRYLTLLDFLYIRDIAQRVQDWKTIFDQLKMHRWLKPFLSLALVVNEINRQLGRGVVFDESLLREESGEPFSPQFWCKSDSIDLPYFLSTSLVLDVYWGRMCERSSFPLWDIGYYFFMTARYYLSGKRRLPYYLCWFPLERLELKRVNL